MTEDGDIGVIFTPDQGAFTMCGHGIIAVIEVADFPTVITRFGRDTRITGSHPFVLEPGTPNRSANISM